MNTCWNMVIDKEINQERSESNMQTNNTEILTV